MSPAVIRRAYSSSPGTVDIAELPGHASIRSGKSNHSSEVGAYKLVSGRVRADLDGVSAPRVFQCQHHLVLALRQEGAGADVA